MKAVALLNAAVLSLALNTNDLEEGPSKSSKGSKREHDSAAVRSLAKLNALLTSVKKQEQSEKIPVTNLMNVLNAGANETSSLYKPEVLNAKNALNRALAQRLQSLQEAETSRAKAATAKEALALVQSKVAAAATKRHEELAQAETRALRSASALEIARTQASSVKALTQLHELLAWSEVEAHLIAEKTVESVGKTNNIQNAATHKSRLQLEQESSNNAELAKMHTATGAARDHAQEIAESSRNVVKQANDYLEEVTNEVDKMQKALELDRHHETIEATEAIVIANAELHVHQSNMDAAKAAVADALMDVAVLRKQKELLDIGHHKVAVQQLQEAQDNLNKAQSAHKTAIEMEVQTKQKLKQAKEESDAQRLSVADAEGAVAQADAEVKKVSAIIDGEKEQTAERRKATQRASQKLFEFTSSASALSNPDEQTALMNELKKAQQAEASYINELNNAMKTKQIAEAKADERRNDLANTKRISREMNDRLALMQNEAVTNHDVQTTETNVKEAVVRVEEAQQEEKSASQQVSEAEQAISVAGKKLPALRDLVERAEAQKSETEKKLESLGGKLKTLQSEHKDEPLAHVSTVAEVAAPIETSKLKIETHPHHLMRKQRAEFYNVELGSGSESSQSEAKSEEEPKLPMRVNVLEDKESINDVVSDLMGDKPAVLDLPKRGTKAEKKEMKSQPPLITSPLRVSNYLRESFTIADFGSNSTCNSKDLTPIMNADSCSEAANAMGFMYLGELSGNRPDVAPGCVISGKNHVNFNSDGRWGSAGRLLCKQADLVMTPSAPMRIQMKSHTNFGTGITLITSPKTRRPIKVFVDNSDGGNWILLLQYRHGLPTSDHSTFGRVPNNAPGHNAQAFAQALGLQREDIEAVRFRATSSNHERMIHFMSTNKNVLDLAYDGKSHDISAEDWKSDTTLLDGHNAILPMGTTSASSKMGFASNPFSTEGHTWNIDSKGQHWAVDDDGPIAETEHEVYVRVRPEILKKHSSLRQ